MKQTGPPLQRRRAGFMRHYKQSAKETGMPIWRIIMITVYAVVVLAIFALD